MGLFYSYKKTGKGIDKNSPKKNRIVVFFEIFLRKFWKLLEVNLLYSIFYIPLVIAYYAFYNVSNFNIKIFLVILCIIAFAVVFGPATAGVFKIMRSYAIEKHSFIFADFKKAFTENFKKSFAMGIINLVVYLSVFAAIKVYPQMSKTMESDLIYIPMILSISLGIAVTMISFYSYLMIVATDVSFKNILKNSVVLTCYALKKNIISFIFTILIAGVFAVLTYLNIYTVFAFPFVPAALIIFIICFNSYPIVQKYVINPYYEQRGEVNPELVDEDEETLFEDRGGSEKPVVQNKKGGRGKTIS